MHKAVKVVTAIIVTATVGGLALAEKPETDKNTRSVQPTAAEWQGAWENTLTQSAAAQTPADIDAALAAFPYPLDRAVTQMGQLIRAAIRVDHPEALQFALTGYRYIPAQHVTSYVSMVAGALKNKDGTLARANAWTAQQNTGEDKVKFTAEELKPPAALASAVPTPQAQLEIALQLYRQADREVSLNQAVEKIASALRAIDHDLVRQNAFIEAQREGKKYDIR